MNSLDAQARLEARVTGRVQGVGFRQFVRYHARRLGLTGWVRNEPDGSVYLVAEGPRELLEQLLDAVRQGHRPRASTMCRCTGCGPGRVRGLRNSLVVKKSVIQVVFSVPPRYLLRGSLTPVQPRPRSCHGRQTCHASRLSAAGRSARTGRDRRLGAPERLRRRPAATTAERSRLGKWNIGQRRADLHRCVGTDGRGNPDAGKPAVHGHSPYPDKICANCQLYVPAESPDQCGGCQLIKGPIHPNGYCTSWVQKAT